MAGYILSIYPSTHEGIRGVGKGEERGGDIVSGVGIIA